MESVVGFAGREDWEICFLAIGGIRSTGSASVSRFSFEMETMEGNVIGGWKGL